MNLKKSIMMIGIGFIIGIAAMIIFGYLVSKYSSGNLLINRPLTFGNITIIAIKETDPNEDIAKSILIKKDGINFFYADFDRFNKVKNIAIVGEKKDIRFNMANSSKPGSWKNATYAYNKNNKTIRDKYIDINFDGRFDLKETFDSNGNRESVDICLNDQWKRVDTIKKGEAIIDGQSYTFTDNYGWILQK